MAFTDGVFRVSNVNNSTENTEFSTLELLELSINTVLFLLISVGNLLTIIAVYKTPSLQTIPNMFVVSLAVADFLTGFAILYYMFNMIPVLEYYFNNMKYLCIVRYALVYTYIAQSVLSLCLISVDRLLYIKYPLRYLTSVTARNAGIMIAISWIFSLIIGTVPLYNYIWVDATGCTNNLTKEFQVYGAFSVFVVCVMCTFYCYFEITRIALRQRRTIKALQVASAYLDGKYCSVDNGYLKSVKLFAVVFFAFLLFWMPINILSLVMQLSNYDVPSWSIYIAITFGYINSGTNFLIYAWGNNLFRRAFLKIFICCVRSSTVSH
ncbi:hypothetical protein SNE40_018928 [Patella caerulea]|uniref:G-protein coupled receptors family 1 profile domain-containing protein n=1 Tax=Patella caerulea TaxID=87958 RepID=A0AAN8P9C9_PATCE